MLDVTGWIALFFLKDRNTTGFSSSKCYLVTVGILTALAFGLVTDLQLFTQTVRRSLKHRSALTPLNSHPTQVVIGHDPAFVNSNSEKNKKNEITMTVFKKETFHPFWLFGILDIGYRY